MPSAPKRCNLVGEFDDFVGVVAARAGQHRNFAFRLFEGDLDHAQVLGAA